MKTWLWLIFVLCLFAPSPVLAEDIQRFPPPEFESGYSFPATTAPDARADWLGYIDVLVLLGALSLAAWLVIYKRSRNGVFYLGLFSLLYFGFYREGCVCAIGAIQNVSLALVDPNYALPLTVLAFFTLPLLFTLFFGRVFCAGVCPLGAIQDLMLIRPIKLPQWVHHGLGLLAYVYLGTAVLFSVMGGAFIICKYDPFVGFFRMTGSFSILLLGFCILIIALFVGRPYCLYLCPYSVLLKWFSRLSMWRVTVGPDENACIQCDACEDACPYNAITPPTPTEQSFLPQDSKRRLAIVALAAPIVLLAGAWLVSLSSETLARMDYTVRLAERIAMEDDGLVEGRTDASTAFRQSGESTEELFLSAHQIQDTYSWGAWILGAFLGLAVVGKLLLFSWEAPRMGYEADRADCLGCGRCFCSCPLERKRLKQLQSASFV